MHWLVGSFGGELTSRFWVSYLSLQCSPLCNVPFLDSVNTQCSIFLGDLLVIMMYASFCTHNIVIIFSSKYYIVLHTFNWQSFPGPSVSHKKRCFFLHVSTSFYQPYGVYTAGILFFCNIKVMVARTYARYRERIYVPLFGIISIHERHSTKTIPNSHFSFGLHVTLAEKSYV